MEWLAAFGRTGVLILAVLLAGWLLLKWVERWRFYRLLERSRISAPELKERLERGDAIVIVDLRVRPQLPWRWRQGRRRHLDSAR